MANRYWIGGSGNWSDIYSATSLIDNYSYANSSIATNVRSGEFNSQSFTGDGGTLDSVVLYGNRINNPTGNISVKIYAHSGVFGTSSLPTGSALATSDELDSSTLSASLSLVEFNFSGDNKIVLSNGTKYVLVVSGAGSGSDLVTFYRDNTSSTHSGNCAIYRSGSWVALSADDLIFYVYSDTVHYGHWSSSSGGLGNASLPTSSDDIFIDSNSGLSGGTITVNDSYCHDFTSTTGVNYAVTYTGIGLYVYGSFVGEAGLTLGGSIPIYFIGSTEIKSITANGVEFNDVYIGDDIDTSDTWDIQDTASINGDFIIYGGNIELGDNLTCTGEFYQENGTFDANDHNVTANDFYFYADEDHTPTVIMGSGTWEATGGEWYLDESNETVTIIPETSTIKLDVSCSFTSTGKTYNNLWIVTDCEITDANTFNDLKINAGANLTLPASKTTTVSSFTAVGTVGNLITLDSSNGTGQFTISKSSGVVSCDYLDISNCNATGGIKWYAGSHSIDGGNNEGWLFRSEPVISTQGAGDGSPKKEKDIHFKRKLIDNKSKEREINRLKKQLLYKEIL